MIKLPWTTYNNPCGWIEPTTYCQLKCEGCYRGEDKGIPQRHKNDYTVLNEIDKQIELRGIKLLTISGGEPLLYPKLGQVIDYAKSKNLQVRLLTNGVLLTPKLIDKLNVDEILIHIFSPSQVKTYAEMFNGKTLFGFNITVSKDNILELPYFLEKIKKTNASRVLLTIKTDFENNTDKMFKQVQEIVELKYGKPMYYLGRTLTNKKSWLIYNHKPLSIKRIPTYLKELKVRAFPNLVNPIGQVLVILNLPEKTSKGWDLCEGCPDAMFYKGKLVPSCLLERIKKGEEI